MNSTMSIIAYLAMYFSCIFFKKAYFIPNVAFDIDIGYVLNFYFMAVAWIAVTEAISAIYAQDTIQLIM